MKKLLSLILTLLPVLAFGQNQGVAVRANSGRATNLTEVNVIASVLHNGIRTPYNSLESAVSNALPGDAIVGAATTHTVSNALILPVGSSLHLNGALINSYVAPLGTAGPTIIVRDNCDVFGGFVDLKLRGVAGGLEKYQAIIGSHNNVNTGTATNVFVYDLSGVGETDCVFVRNTNKSDIIFTSCNFTSRWDAVAFMEAAHQFRFYNCALASIGPNNITGSENRGNVIAVEASATGSKVQLYGGSMVTSNTLGSLIETAGGIRFELHNVAVTNYYQPSTIDITLAAADVLYLDGTQIQNSRIDDDFGNGTIIRQPSTYVGDYYGDGAGLTNIPSSSVSGANFWRTNATLGGITNVNETAVSVLVRSNTITAGAITNSGNVQSATLNTTGTMRSGGDLTVAGVNGANMVYLQLVPSGLSAQVNLKGINTAQTGDLPMFMLQAAQSGKTNIGIIFVANASNGGIWSNWPSLRVESSTNNVGLSVRQGTNDVYANLTAAKLLASDTITATNGYISGTTGGATTGFSVDGTGNITNYGRHAVIANGVQTMIDSNTIAAGAITNSGNIQTATLNLSGSLRGATDSFFPTYYVLDGANSIFILNKNNGLVVSSNTPIRWARSATTWTGQDTRLLNVTTPTSATVSLTTSDGLAANFVISGYSLATNGCILPQLSAVPTNAILPVSSGNTNLTIINLGGELMVLNTNAAAAGSFITNFLSTAYVSSTIASASKVSLSSTVTADITSITLTPGTWDVEANLNFAFAGATASQLVAWVNTTSATYPTSGLECYQGLQFAGASVTTTVTIPRNRITVTANTTCYLSGQATFSVGTTDGFGTITARRVK